MLNKLVILLALFGASLITYSYMMSHCFSRSTSAFKYFPVLNLFTNYTLPIILVAMAGQNTTLRQYVQGLFFVTSPFYVLNNGKLCLCQNSGHSGAVPIARGAGEIIIATAGIRWGHFKLAIKRRALGGARAESPHTYHEEEEKRAAPRAQDS